VQTAYDLAQARKHEGRITVQRVPWLADGDAMDSAA
jgi:hypothetical protein